MGSTLEHGIYLPSEGEKNCYQGLAGNWNKVDGALGDVAGLKQLIESKFTKEIVTELPTEDINPYCIYMVLKTDPETNNIYDEWVYINNAWEYLGNTKVDMTQYYTKQEVNELPAVASGVTSTKVGNYDTHLADSNIHVTSADKTKWNTIALIKQLRLVNTQVGSSTTIAFANIDDTNGIKVGDKCMDLDAKMFEITAVDTTNQTVTVGTALIDLALDANVVHTSGNETISGDKVFSNRLIKNIDVVLGTAPSTGKFSNIDIADNNKSSLLQVLGGVYNTGNSYAGFFVQNKTADDGSGLSPTGTLRTCGFNVNLPASSTSEGQGSITPRANKTTDFGLLSYQWRNLWCEKLFLNGTELDPSAFALDNAVVHLSGNETVGGQKIFANNRIIVGRNTDSNSAIQLINSDVVGDSANGSSGFEVYGSSISDDNKIGGLTVGEYSNNGGAYATIEVNRTVSGVKTTTAIRSLIRSDGSKEFSPSTDNDIKLGHSSFRWSEVYATNYYYGSNNVEFSTKFVTTDTAQTITGNKTFGNGTLTVDNGIGSNVHGEIKLSGSRSGYIVADNSADGVFDSAGCGVSILLQDSGKPLHVGGYKVDSNGRVFADNTNKNPVLSIASSLIKTAILVPENDTGNSSFRILSQIDYANGNTSKTLDVRFIQYDNANATSAIYSNDDGKTALGASSRKWSNVLTYKVNDVEPSSLGMPSDRSARVDISGYFTNMGNGGINQYTAVANGFIYLKVSDVVTMHMMSLGSNTLSNYADTKGRNSTGLLYGLFPVRKDDIFTCEWYTTATNVTLNNAYFIPCQGNI